MTDVNETPAGSSTATNLAHYTYDPLSRRTALAYGNGTSAGYSYDAYNGLTSIALNFAAGSNPPSITWGYARDVKERRGGDSISVGSLWHPTLGTWETGWPTFSPNNLNEITSIQPQGSTLTLGYDPTGNLTSDQSAPNGTATYSWDLKNRLTSASNSQHASSYTYDAFSRRASKTVDGVATVFVEDGSRTIADYNASGQEIVHYVYGSDSAPIAMEYFGGAATYSSILWLHADALGSVAYISKANGQASEGYVYDPYGQSRYSTTEPYRFAGMRLDNETGLYYDRARYYSPLLGRFVSPDPTGTHGGINLYAYAENDPLNHVDFTGNDDTGADWWDEGGGGGGGPGGGGDYFAGAGTTESSFGSSSGDCNCAAGQSNDGYGGEDPGGIYSAPGGAFGAARTLTTYDYGNGNTVTFNGLGEQTSATGVFAASTVAAPAGNAVPGLLDAIGAGILRILGALGSVLSLSGDTPQSQTLYSAVDQQELASIQSTGNYTIPPGGTEGKYFYPTPGQAQNLANMYQAQGIGPGPYTLTSGQFQQQELPPPFPVSGEGQVYFLPANLFPRAATVYPR